MEKLLSIGEASKYLSVSIQTLRRWDVLGKLVPIKTKGGHRKYKTSDLEKIISKVTDNSVAYVRSHKIEKINEQINAIEAYCNKQGKTVNIIKDVAPGHDFKRKGLKELLRLIENRKINEIIVYSIDRIGTLGYDLFKEICKFNKVRITILNKICH